MDGVVTPSEVIMAERGWNLATGLALPIEASGGGGVCNKSKCVSVIDNGLGVSCASDKRLQF